jgi:hypothetical protein
MKTNSEPSGGTASSDGDKPTPASVEPEKEYETVNLSEIHIIEKCYPRLSVNSEVVEDIIESILLGREIPPPVLNKAHEAVDGIPRIEAYRRLKIELIRCEIIDCPTKEIYAEAIRRNRYNGQRYTREERDQQIHRLRNIEGRSEKEVAEILGISEATVSRRSTFLRDFSPLQMQDTKINNAVKAQREDVENDIDLGLPQKAVADKHQISVSRVSQIAKDYYNRVNVPLSIVFTDSNWGRFSTILKASLKLDEFQIIFTPEGIYLQGKCFAFWFYYFIPKENFNEYTCKESLVWKPTKHFQPFETWRSVVILTASENKVKITDKHTSLLSSEVLDIAIGNEVKDALENFDCYTGEPTIECNFKFTVERDFLKTPAKFTESHLLAKDGTVYLIGKTKESWSCWRTISISEKFSGENFFLKLDNDEEQNFAEFIYKMPSLFYTVYGKKKEDETNLAIVGVIPLNSSLRAIIGLVLFNGNNIDLSLAGDYLPHIDESPTG